MTETETGPSSELTGLGVAALAPKMLSGEVTAVALTQACLDRIAVFEPKLNSIITLLAETALRRAAALDAERKAGKIRGPLHGIPIALKDSIDTGGERTTGGSPVFKGRVPAEDATLVARLRAAGAIVIAKNNLNEWCMSAGESSYYGRVRNPWNLAHETGGSSSGSCAGVAADLFPAAIGTDTGGSIRNPAAWCGVVGFKPTNGLVPNRGTIPLTPLLDVAGPIAKSVEDAAIVMDAIAGYDELDITSIDRPKEDYVSALRQPVDGFRVGMPVGFFDTIGAEIAPTVWAAIDVVKQLVREMSETALPDAGDAMALMPFGETYAWHEPRLKSLRYLYSSQDQLLLDSLAGQKAEDYIRARWTTETLRRTINRTLAERGVDLLVFPTVRAAAPMAITRAGRRPDAARDTAALRDSGLFNVLGLPAISIPCGFTASGMPVGLCVAGPRFAEGKVLALAHAYERATDWRPRRPALSPATPVPAIPREGADGA